MSGRDASSQSGHRLTSISTMWTVLRAAHEGPPDEAAHAQNLLLRRYGGAIYRYLLSAVRDVGAAEDLAQEFALRLVQGNFRHVSPERGRFRSYIKTVLFHMVSEHRKRALRQVPCAPLEESAVAAPDEPLGGQDEAFLVSWRDELLARVWAALEDAHAEAYAILRYKAEHPEATSEAMAGHFTTTLGKSVNAAGIRQVLRRARDRFASLLMEEVAHSLDDPSDEAVEEELIELGLMQYCRRTQSTATPTRLSRG